MGKNYSKNKATLKKIEMFFEKEEEKALAVFKESIQDVVEDASLPLSAGGRMHVDTGFLRSSGVGAINQIPSGPSEGRKRIAGEVGVLSEYSNYNPSGALEAVLPKVRVGDVFYFGWTAHYANIRNAYDGFLDAAVQKWPEIVDKNKRRIEK